MNDLRLLKAKKFIAAAMLGAFAITFPAAADASIKRLHDPKVDTNADDVFKRADKEMYDNKLAMKAQRTN